MDELLLKKKPNFRAPKKSLRRFLTKRIWLYLCGAIVAAMFAASMALPFFLGESCDPERTIKVGGQLMRGCEH